MINLSQVMLNNGVVFTSSEDKTILSSALEQKVFLEHSCKTGRCGVCKVKLVAGNTAVLQEECLDQEELDNNFILTCCRQAVTSVTLDAEDLKGLTDIEIQTAPCKVDSIEYFTSDVVEITLRFPPSVNIKYLAGQYADIIGKNGIRRSYSIANAPGNDKSLKFHIKKVDNGEMSRYWFEEVKPNDLLRIELPLGTFFLRESQQKNLILLATGTGIAPIKAILEDLSSNQEKNTYSQIYLYWGGRSEKDIYWQPDLPLQNLIFTPVLSRADTTWQGAKGYIQDILVLDEVNLTESDVYACGSEAMIHSAKNTLLKNGLAERFFHSDAFVSSS